MATTPHPSILATQPATRPPGDHCPWCGQPVTHEQFEAITARIAAQERERTAQAERKLREQLAAEKARIEATAQAQITKVQADAQAAATAAAKAASEREAKARADATKTAEAAAAARVASADAARKQAQEQLAAEKAKTEAVVAERLRAQRETLEAAKVDAVNGERAKAFAERQKLDTKLAALQRQLQAKTAGELGEGAEIDLYETLRVAFPDDRFTRVKKGTAGADIIHEILQAGRIAGRIVYDSKNRDAWRNDYATKLRADQLAARADHAVLSTRVFPSGAHQIHTQDGVIVANPARVVEIIGILRRHVLSVDSLRLAGRARAEKADRLYAFITSERCSQLLDEIDTVTDDLLALEVKEVKSHETTWRQRGTLLRQVQRVRGSLVTEIDQITGASGIEATA
jgi:hypothetical protein